MNRFGRIVMLAVTAAALFLSSPTPARAGRADTGMLWRVDSANATVYVLGSIHFCKPEFYPMPDHVEEAFTRSEVLAVEADVMAFDQAKLFILMQRNGLYRDDKTLPQNVAQRTQEKLVEKGVNLEAFKRVRPWVLATTLEVDGYKAHGYSQELGIDLHFLKRAKEMGLEVKELEGVEEQIQAFSSMAPEVEDLYLYYTLDNMDRVESYMANLFLSWQDGDMAAMEALLMEPIERFPDFLPFYQTLIWDRNKLMADRVEEYLADGRTHFVILGSFHLPGEKGVISLLKARGYQVEQVAINIP